MTTETEPLRVGAIVKAAATGLAAVLVAFALCVLLINTVGDGLDTGQMLNLGLLFLGVLAAALMVGPFVATRMAADNLFDLGVVAAGSEALAVAVLAILLAGDADESRPLAAVVAFTVSLVLGLAGATLGRKR